MTNQPTIYTLTDAHKRRLKPWADKWIANALNATLLTDAEREVIRTAVLGLYAAADKPAPKAVVFCSSPISGAIAAGVAAGVWHLRQHPEIHASLFGRSVTEREFMAAIGPACARATLAAMRGVPNGPQVPSATRREAPQKQPDATYAATDDATDDATADATDDATYAATRAATADATDATDLSAVVKFLVLCCGYYYRLRNGGNQWSGWVAFLSFFRHVARLPLDYTKWDHYEVAATAGPRYTHADFCIVCDRPTTLTQDEQHRPHGERGPSHRWVDGWGLYYWHGVRVPARLIESPESYTAADIAAETNSEIVRALAERMGWEAFVKRLDVTTVDSWTDPTTGLAYELLESRTHIGDGQPRFLRMTSPTLKDGSRPQYVEPVHPDLATAQAARRWQIRNADQTWPTPAECNDNSILIYAQEA